ncbi:MAG: Asp-tRNA(Asn)/Glu-tRNA(Gln) amidotransferase GatCAB subunit B, partial [candidate division Zixibacteria bacterium]|nr:Asp-tRNA(Asn)/Glu-tRNA(Gln) amidotransferase GatCAB subunit B [candidate division Zixibacteria bacterium]NIW39377.1 Asp-tRNA(Asn)/Glu-tRNA(Gln) amidotransferase GatCAB subunit B [candidate division Zixibacteria bacterium]NIX58626.1 Asp-tRNA(Asn)/Glu-tRNA(Gln) amidotransferase GatCAB subunit B [candidate division Zixibacteria bacterium]
EEPFGVKTEMKNMNSFRGVERALQFEINRQTEVLQSGGTVTQDTLLWNETENRAERMRTKEEAEDYRYFPEPDLLPL